MCVAGYVLDIYVRWRPVEDGTPNVHSIDTPLDPELLNFIYLQHVQPRMEEIRSLCANLGAVLGPALYAHDILLSRDGRLPVCEAGLKFDDATLLDHLWPVSSELDFMRGTFAYEFAEKAGRMIVESAKNKSSQSTEWIFS